MTKLLDQAISRVRAMSPESQDDLARVLLNLSGGAETAYALTPDEKQSLAPSLEEAARGAFATDEEVQRIWSKHGL